jgi:DNA replication protein DnaC
VPQFLRVSNQQYDEVDLIIANSKYSNNVCPTCGVHSEEIAPGKFEFPPSTFRLFGQEYPCNCEFQITLMRHYLYSHIPDAYWRYNEKDYYGDPEAWEETQRYLDCWQGMKNQGIGLEFYSPRQGTGKTFLATYIGRELIQRKERVYFIGFRSIMDLYTRPYEVRKKEEDRLHNDTILILDEVVPSISLAQQAHFGDQFEELIRDRTNYGRITILTTNLTPDELEDHYPRTYSLLSAREKRIKINGDDVRKEGIGTLNLELAENNEIRPIS